jgi:glutamate---cysteine ligase / carboxylate-amine ligase
MHAWNRHEPHNGNLPGVDGPKTTVALDAHALRARFVAGRPLTFGLEEELMVLDPETLDLAPRAAVLLERVPEDLPVKLELPASQLEIFTPARARIDELAEDLTSARRQLASSLAGAALLVAAGAHPFASTEGTLNVADRYERLEREYGSVARRQLVCGLHVHVAIGGPDCALAVYNAMRSHLPELAALAGNAPFYGGKDSGMASIRPLISAQLPRQGVPPAYASWEQLADDLGWGAAAGRLDGFFGWWWEMRLHPLFGTLEVRVPDAQTRLEDALAVVGATAGLVLWLCARYDAGELPPPDAGWRIAENRWSAARRGARGQMADLHSGVLHETAELLVQRLDEIGPYADRVGAAGALEAARRLVERSGAERQRAAAAESGLLGLVARLADQFV